MRSTMPSDSASSADTMRPLAIKSTAAAMPVRRGRRCVPPAPGTMPSFTSGSPSFAVADAMRKWQASAISQPPPSAAPLIAATTGFSLCSIRSITCGNVGSAIGAPNSRMSAPPTKFCPAPVMTTALISSDAAACSIAAKSPARMSADAALTGGLSIVTTSTPSVATPETVSENFRLTSSILCLPQGWSTCSSGRASVECRQTLVGTTAVAWISTLARSSTRATTCMAAMAG